MYRTIGGLLSLCLVVLGIVSCENDDSVGVTVRPQDDVIIHAIDTFHVETSDMFDMVMSAQADSMYLGEFYSPTYGTTKAELLVQLTPPEKYEFPSVEMNPTADSLVLNMYYKTWYGASNVPMEISVYEMNKGNIEYDARYTSDLDISQYTDGSILMGKRLVTSIDLSIPDSVRNEDDFIPSVRYKFDDVQRDKFFNIAKTPFSTLEEFLDNFKGMHITTRYGASTVFTFFQIDLKLHYHYTYVKNGKDTVVNTSIIFPANKEVRQLNKFSHADIKDVVEQNDSINFLKANAGIYTKVSLPIGRMCSKIKQKIGNKELHVNGSALHVELADMEELDLDLGRPNVIMAITEAEYEDFMKNYNLPAISDTNMVIGYYDTKLNAYNLDVSYYITKKLRKYTDVEIDENEKLDLMLVPVEVKQSVDQSTGTVIVTRIRPQSKVAGVRIRSGKNHISPMRVKLLYAGF